MAALLSAAGLRLLLASINQLAYVVPYEEIMPCLTGCDTLSNTALSPTEQTKLVAFRLRACFSAQSQISFSAPLTICMTHTDHTVVGPWYGQFHRHNRAHGHTRKQHTLQAPDRSPASRQ